jgi:hypothetical protein
MVGPAPGDQAGQAGRRHPGRNRAGHRAGQPSRYRPKRSAGLPGPGPTSGPSSKPRHHAPGTQTAHPRPAVRGHPYRGPAGTHRRAHAVLGRRGHHRPHRGTAPARRPVADHPGVTVDLIRRLAAHYYNATMAGVLAPPAPPHRHRPDLPRPEPPRCAATTASPRSARLPHRPVMMTRWSASPRPRPN